MSLLSVNDVFHSLTGLEEIQGKVHRIPCASRVSILEPCASNVFIFLVDNVLDVLEMFLDMVGTWTPSVRNRPA